MARKRTPETMMGIDGYLVPRLIRPRPRPRRKRIPVPGTLYGRDGVRREVADLEPYFQPSETELAAATKFFATDIPDVNVCIIEWPES